MCAEDIAAVELPLAALAPLVVVVRGSTWQAVGKGEDFSVYCRCSSRLTFSARRVEFPLAVEHHTLSPICTKVASNPPIRLR